MDLSRQFAPRISLISRRVTSCLGMLFSSESLTCFLFSFLTRATAEPTLGRALWRRQALVTLPKVSGSPDVQQLCNHLSLLVRREHCN